MERRKQGCRSRPDAFAVDDAALPPLDCPPLIETG